MNWEQVEGNWQQFKGKARQTWGQLTDDELEQANGKRDEMAGLIEKKYGVAKEEAEKQLDEFASNCRC